MSQITNLGSYIDGIATGKEEMRLMVDVIVGAQLWFVALALVLQ